MEDQLLNPCHPERSPSDVGARRSRRACPELAEGTPRIYRSPCGLKEHAVTASARKELYLRISLSVIALEAQWQIAVVRGPGPNWSQAPRWGC